MVIDSISDMLTRIRNANQQFKNYTAMDSSVLLKKIAKILYEEGYIGGYKVKVIKNSPKQQLFIYLVYRNDGQSRVISGLKRISKPGLRIYSKVDDIPRVLNGLGRVILSTSEGIMEGEKARSKNLGGEVIAFIW